MKRALKIWRRSLSILWENMGAFLVASIAFMAGSILVLPIAPLFFGLFMMAGSAAGGESPRARDILEGFSHFCAAWAFAIILLSSSFLIFAVVIGAIVWGASPMSVTLAFMAASFFMGTISLVVFCAMPSYISEGGGVLHSLNKAGGLIKRRFSTAVMLAFAVAMMQLLFSPTLVGIGLPYAFGAIAFTLFARD